MDKEKEIKNEMIREVFGEQWVNDPICLDDGTIKAFYNSGYRKADEVRKETAREILTMLYKEAVEYGKETIGIEWIAQKYGVEVK